MVAFAHPEVGFRSKTADAGAAYAFRRVIGRWQKSDFAGRPLAIADLSTALTRTAAYQQTICSVDAEAYLKRTITGMRTPRLSPLKRCRTA